jgi:hypothetical protein
MAFEVVMEELRESGFFTFDERAPSHAALRMRVVRKLREVK